MTTPNTTSDRGPLVWYLGLGLVLVLGVIALLVARGSGDDEVSDEVRRQQTGEVAVGDQTTTEPTDQETTPEDTTAEETPAEEGSGEEATPLPAYDPEQATDEAIGATIPTVSGTTLDGEPLTIGAADGKAKVILFVAHWCPHCQREVPEIVEHLQDTPMPDDVELLTVSTSVAPERGNYPPSEWLDEEGWTAPVLADSDDGAAGEAYGLTAFPYFVVADAEGKVVARASGEIPMDAFDELVAAAQSGTPID